jgi:dipeptidyl aminopeptidase/acylaminoacyl peptidase
MIRIFFLLILSIFPDILIAQVPKHLSELFAYRKSTPFAFQLKDSEKFKNVVVQTININNDKLQKIEAYLIEPRSEGKYPVVIFQHGGENDNDYFFQEGKELSKKGIICLLIEAPWLRPVYKNNMLWGNTSQFYRQGIIDIQRSIDFLSTLPKVDTSRIAFTGHSYGAQLGGILAGIEPRIKAYVLMSGTAELTSLLKETNHPRINIIRDSIPLDFNNWLKQMEPLNPIHYIRHSKSPVFFQFAANDEYDIDEIEAKKYVAAAPLTEHVRFYNSGHQMINKKAEEDRTKWIVQKLKKQEPSESSIKQ